MIDGVNVLSKAEIMESPAWPAAVFLICGLVLAVCIILFVEYFGEKLSFIAGAIGFVSLIFMIMLLATGELFFENPTGRYEYKVTIDESVNFVEFNYRYDIIDQEGLIYTIVDREEIQ